MKWKELITKNEIPKNHQEAFKNLANKLIFTEPVDINITKENVKEISQKIQEEYIKLDINLLDKRKQQINSFLGTLKLDLDEEEYDNNDYPLIEDKNKISDKEFLEDFLNLFRAKRGVDDSIGYYPWGFTPKLSQNIEDFEIGKNCFGITTFMGSVCKKRGIDVELGITPDHPYVIANLPDGTYALDGQTKTKKLEGVLEDHGNYKIYRTTEEDNILTKMIMIQNFDNAVVYEILENMEVLRQVSLGKTGITLPGSYESGIKIASDNKEVLQKINWKDLQNELFPEIIKSFSDCKEEWSQEVSRVASRRKEFHAENIFVKIAYKAQGETSFKEQDFREGQKALGVLFKTHKNEIIQFLKENVNFNDSVPEDVKKYFSYLKTEVEKQKESGVIADIYNIIEDKLVDKTPKE